MFVKMEDHEKDGHVNWESYKKAQVDNGEMCSRCGSYIYINADGYKRECMQCKHIAESDRLNHDRLIRCPSCLHTWSPYGYDDYEILEDGEHDISCPKCDKEFYISTHVSFTFDSPEIEQDENQD